MKRAMFWLWGAVTAVVFAACCVLRFDIWSWLSAFSAYANYAQQHPVPILFIKGIVRGRDSPLDPRVEITFRNAGRSPMFITGVTLRARGQTYTRWAQALAIPPGQRFMLSSASDAFLHPRAFEPLCDGIALATLKPTDAELNDDTAGWLEDACRHLTNCALELTVKHALAKTGPLSMSWFHVTTKLTV